MNFDSMNQIQRRLHNAACVLGADGDEYGFEKLQRDAIAEIERLRQHAVVLAATAEEVERERCAKVNRDRAMKIEADAQRASDAGDHDEVSALRATAWQLIVAEREILGA